MDYLASPSSFLGHTIDNGRLRFIDVLGVGAYGVVYTAQDFDGRLYAVKCLSKVGLDARQRRFQQREIQLHHALSHHPNVVRLDRIVNDLTHVYVVMEHCPEGDLFAMITERGGYIGQDRLIKDVFLQLLDAVQECHKLGVYHRDLKPENIMVLEGGRRLKLADFGLATKEKVSTDFGCGSTFYMSPECQSGLHHTLPFYSTAANDVWSLGVVLVNLTCGRNPWKQASLRDETFRAFLADPLRNFLTEILPLSQECNNILKRIFVIEETQRVSLPELRKLVQRCHTFTTIPNPALPQPIAVPQVGTPVINSDISSFDSFFIPPQEVTRTASCSSSTSSAASLSSTTSSNSNTYDGMPLTPQTPLTFQHQHVHPKGQVLSFGIESLGLDSPTSLSRPFEQRNESTNHVEAY